jgi:hypothetical protein
MAEYIIQFLLNKLNFCCGNYSREETNKGRNLYDDIGYSFFYDFFFGLTVVEITLILNHIYCPN